MKALFVHADRFEYRVTEKAQEAEPLEGALKGQSISDCLVSFITFEEADSNDLEGIVSKAVEEIKAVRAEVSPRAILLYPYAHLSSSLADPSVAMEGFRILRNALAGEPSIHCAPFGWYKRFRLECKGHPRSEIFRSIEPGRRDGPLHRFRQQGRPHPVSELSARLRRIFLSLGLDEVINPSIVDEREVYAQYGVEAPLILDRVYYLAGLERPDVGLSDAKMDEICRIVPGFDAKEDLQTFLRRFKEGKVEADDFIDEMVKVLEISEQQAKEIVESVFVELRERKPKPTRKTLRSHMTSLWYRTLVEISKHRRPPIRLFSIGPRFRREQRQDQRHLFESTSASVVIMDSGFDLAEGVDLTRQILKGLGFEKMVFRQKEVTSNYYRPGTDTEVYVSLRGQEYEVANLGFYSQESLDQYGIKHQVFNLGFGVERLAMVLHDAADIRALVYPQFYEEKTYSDEEIASMICAERRPRSTEGKLLAKRIAEAALEHRETKGPAQVLAFEGPFLGRQLKVWIYNWDQGKALVSHAAFNELYVYKGNIYGLPPTPPEYGGEFQEVYRDGVRIRVCFLELIAEGVAASLEDGTSGNQGEFYIRFRNIKRPAQINLRIPEELYRYITGRNKKIKIGGPLYFGIRARF